MFKFKVDNNDNITPCDDNDAKPMTMTIQAVQQQVNAILFGCITATSLKEFTNQQAKHKYGRLSLPKIPDHTLSILPFLAIKYAKTDDHDTYLLHQWNQSNTTCIVNKKANH